MIKSKFYLSPFVLLITSFIFFGVLTVATKIIRNQKLDKMLRLLSNKKFEEFDQLVERRLVRIVFDPFNLDYIKLNRYFLTQEKPEINKLFLKFEKTRLNYRQKDEIDLKAFNYYLSENDRIKTKKYYERIIHSDTNKMKKEVERLYNIYIEKGTKYLDDLLNETESLEDKYKSANELLISAIYRNIGNKEKEKEYQILAKKHLTRLG